MADLRPKGEAMAASVGDGTARIDRTSFADGFMKLARLREHGFLSQQEFNELKAALISQAKRPSSVSGEMQVVRTWPVSDDPVAILMPIPAIPFKITKKGVALVIAVVAAFAAYGYLSQHYEKRQRQEREFAADAKRQVELMTEAHLVAEASPQQMIDTHEAAMRAKVQRATVAAAAVTVAADAKKETENGKDRAEAACKDAVQASLNNPGSAEFLDTGVEMMEGKYKVTLVLRPKSVFGALIRDTSRCVVLPDSFQVASVTQT
jgi:hypothetical protein